MADEKFLNIVTRASRGEYYLPEIQRSFIWKPEQVRNLCDSVFKDYPISVLLLWDNPDYVQTQRGGLNVRQPFWIIDGQQRITSLCLLFGHKPYWYGPEEWRELRNKKGRVFININLRNGQAQFRGHLIGGQDWKGVQVSEVLSRQEEGEVADLVRQLSNGDTFVYQYMIGPLLRLWNVRNKTIPLVVIPGKEPEEMAEIFGRLNRGGTRIKETDVRFAIIAAHNPGWRRDEFDPFLAELEERDWDIQPGYLLQAMTVLHLGKARMSEVSSDFWRSEVQRVWAVLREALDEIITLLWDRGIPAIDLIPSEYTLIPLLAMHTKFRRTQGYSFDALYRWFLIANWDARYSGAPLEKLASDASAIHSSSTLAEALDKMPHEASLSREQLVYLFKEPFRKGEFAGLLIHLLLWHRDAHDWLQPLKLRAAGTNNWVLRPHWHHILPRAWAKRNDFPDADCVANVTILTESTNVRKLGARPPWDYVQRNNIPQQALAEHFVPEEFALKFVNGERLTKRGFVKFLRGRANLLAIAATKYLGLEEEENA